MGRPSLAPGIYFRLLRIGLEEGVPDHSTISRRRIDVKPQRGRRHGQGNREEQAAV